MFRLDRSQLFSIWRTAILSESLLLLWNFKNVQMTVLFSIWKNLWKNYIACNALNSRAFSTAGLFSDVCSRGPAFQRQCGLQAQTTRFKVLPSLSFLLPDSEALIFFLSCTLNAQNISQKSLYLSNCYPRKFFLQKLQVPSRNSQGCRISGTNWDNDQDKNYRNGIRCKPAV